MWTVNRPDIDVGKAFALCVNTIKSKNLRERLQSVTEHIVGAANEYASRATRQELHLIPKQNNVGGTVTKTEMIRLYDRRMAAKSAPGRKIYDAIKLLASNDQCPFCDHGVVSTLDHVLPKTLYPILAITPDNLVACCKDCNNAKGSQAPESAADVVLHPYFDDVTDKVWLTARVISGPVAAVIFGTKREASWSDELNDRIANQFRLLGLRALYSKQAARTISGNRNLLMRYHDEGGPEAVRDELRRQYESWRAHRLNCWQTATFRALSKSKWYCEEGHRL